MKKLSGYHDVKYKLMEEGNMKVNTERNIFVFSKRYKVMLDELRNLEKGRLLDIGCGEGVLLENAKRQGFDVTGVDFSENAIKICHQKNLNAICLDIEGEELPFNEEFDIVIAGEIIEHLYDYYRFLASANNCLRGNGLLFLTTPNSAWFVCRVLHLLGKAATEMDTRQHLRFFSLRYLLSICRDQGFKLEKNLAYASFPFIRNKLLKVPPFLSSLLSASFILLLRKDDKPKYSDLAPLLEERQKPWLERAGIPLSEKPS